MKCLSPTPSYQVSKTQIKGKGVIWSIVCPCKKSNYLWSLETFSSKCVSEWPKCMAFLLPLTESSFILHFKTLKSPFPSSRQRQKFTDMLCLPSQCRGGTGAGALFCLLDWLVWFSFWVAPRGMWNFPDQGFNSCPLTWKCINHWATEEALSFIFKR